MGNLLKQYIQTHANSKSKTRGRHIYRSNGVANISYDLNSMTASAEVRGGSRYSVMIRLGNNLNDMTSACTCPYNFGGICKHQVAALLALQDHMPAAVLNSLGDDRPALLLPSEQKRSRTISGLVITNYSDEVSSLIKQYCDPVFIEEARYAGNSYESDIIQFVPGKNIHFSVESTYYYTQQYIVRFEMAIDGVEVNCTCRPKEPGQCIHVAMAFMMLAGIHMRFLNLLDRAYADDVLKRLCDDYGVPYDPKDVHKSITLDILDGKLIHRFVEGYEKISPVSGPALENNKSFLASVLGKANTEKFQLPDAKEYKPGKAKRGYGIVFFHDEGKFHPYYQLHSITANLSKAEDKLTTSIKSTGADRDFEPNEHQEIIEGFVRQFDKCTSMRYENDADGILAYCRDIFPVLQGVFLSLNEHDFVFTSTQNLSWDIKIRKSDLCPVQINKSPARLRIKLTENEKTVDAIPWIVCGKDEFILDMESVHSYFVGYAMVQRGGELFLIENDTTISAILYFVHEKLSAISHHKESFIRHYILPLTTHFEVQMDGITDLEIKNMPSKPIKAKVYLSGLGEHVMLRPIVEYSGGHEQNIFENGVKVSEVDGQLTRHNRDLTYESVFFETLRNLHPKFQKQFPEAFYHLTIDEMTADLWFLDAFEVLSSAGIEVLGFNELKHFNYRPHKASIKTGLTSGEDWFEIHVEVAFGDMSVSLTKVRKAIMKKERYVTLDDGSLGVLPHEWIDRFERMFRQGELKGNTIKISSRKFMIINDLFDKIDDLEIRRQLDEKQQKLLSFSSIKDVRTPKGIKATLRDYQKEGLNWLNFLHEFGWGGILADDMGLGKTLQVLTFLVRQKSKTTPSSLIVVPTTLIFNWENEIQKFCPTLDAYFYYGTNRDKDHKPFQSYDLVITTYGLMVNDIEILRKYTFNYIILDESQAIKNQQSQRFKAACLLKGKNKLTMTGTPVENNTFDLYAQMHFVNPGLLGSAKAFKENFSQPIDRDGDKMVSAELKNLIHPFVIRRTKEQVARELPPKTEEILYCEMKQEQRKVYDAFRNKYRDALLGKIEDQGLEKSKIYVLEGLTKLRQICDSPALLPDAEDYGHESIKTEELMRNIREKTGKHKIIVFSQYVSMLQLITQSLKDEGFDHEYLDGRSSKKAREASVQRFQEDDTCRVFLISLKAGGTGLNLTAADYVFLIDPWWNPAVESQAIDRCYRIGQDKKVFAYRMICKNTVEEKIINYQKRKQAVAADIIQAEESFMKQLTKDDIEGLFG